MSKSINSCCKHLKSRVDQVSTHTPSIKCHEEVMSKLSSCTNEDCIGDLNHCDEKLCHHKKGKYMKDKMKTISSKSKLGLHQSLSAPGTKSPGQKQKDRYLKTVKSKSAPIVQTPKLEDSVDFIPVKLTSVNERKQRPQKRAKQILESRIGVRRKTVKPYRPTWDEILRNNVEVVSKNEKIPLKKILQSNNCTHCGSSEQSSARSVNKISENQPSNYLEQNDNMCNTRKSSESSNSEKLPMFEHKNSCDPVTTLDFLIRQLRDGLLKKPQNDNLQNIIDDMENALLKISVGSETQPLNAEVGEKEVPAPSIPLSAASTTSHEKNRNKHLDILQLEHNLERSCRFLQSLCIKQKENCSNHLREQEQLSLQLAESRRLLAVSKTKEKNYEVTIGDLRLKLQEANTKTDQLKQSLQDLENKNATLKEENEAMTSLKKSLKRAIVRLKQVAGEKEKLQSKLSLKDLEIEKLKVLLEVKSGQKIDLQLNDALQSGKNDLNEKDFDEKDLSIISVSTATSWSDRPGLICSSQASSSPRRSPSPYNSWQHISSIVQQPSAAADINRGIAALLRELKNKSEQLAPLELELQDPSSCSSLWSDRDANCKVVYSDGESEGFSS